MIRLDGSGLVGELLRFVDTLCEQLLLGGREQLVDDFLQSFARARIVGIAPQSLSIQVGGVLLRRAYVGTGGKRLIRARQQRFQHLVAYSRE